MLILRSFGKAKVGAMIKLFHLHGLSDSIAIQSQLHLIKELRYQL